MNIQPPHPDFKEWKANMGWENLGNHPQAHARLRKIHHEEWVQWKQNEEALKRIITRLKADVKSRLNMKNLTQNSLVGNMDVEKATYLIAEAIFWNGWD